jgi:hypothetical protein
MEQGQYVFRVLKTRDGEREYYHKGLHDLGEVQTKEQVDEFLDEFTKNFWFGDEGEKDETSGDGYWFFWEIITSLYDWKFVTEEEFNILKQYI